MEMFHLNKSDKTVVKVIPLSTIYYLRELILVVQMCLSGSNTEPAGHLSTAMVLFL